MSWSHPLGDTTNRQTNPACWLARRPVGVSLLARNGVWKPATIPGGPNHASFTHYRNSRIAKNQSNLPKPHQQDKQTDSFSPTVWYLHPLGRTPAQTYLPSAHVLDLHPGGRSWEPANVPRRVRAYVLELPAHRYHKQTNQSSSRAGSQITLWG
jgi:hypothetical protein